MIKIRFSVRPDQGENSGFDLGDMEFSGDLGRVGSTGRTPDQGMMIYLSVSLLLDTFRLFLEGSQSVFSYTGADTSFNVRVRRIKKGRLSVFLNKEPVTNASQAELSNALLVAAEEFLAEVLDLPETDVARIDYLGALERFRPLVDPTHPKTRHA
ncbi:hypothetical protein FBY35_6769 [Streptomyces sp. SLBN-118]|uniref:hypothetical protein n=1 Tax=Streptomyces sp. SLBN-118 TaxID=2768454 RepID=UPI001151ED79|nr:hypothetical protein [Streptomyces sp. SLBN-118]TQK45216.1 hypothetical protein FBY35_6769 [Streptomyces sp. SLBN-118]